MNESTIVNLLLIQPLRHVLEVRMPGKPNTILDVKVPWGGCWKSYTLINVVNAKTKGVKEGGGSGKTSSRSRHLIWVLKNEEELAKSGGASQAADPA